MKNQSFAKYLFNWKKPCKYDIKLVSEWKIWVGVWFTLQSEFSCRRMTRESRDGALVISAAPDDYRVVDQAKWPTVLARGSGSFEPMYKSCGHCTNAWLSRPVFCPVLIKTSPPPSLKYQWFAAKESLDRPTKFTQYKMTLNVKDLEMRTTSKLTHLRTSLPHSQDNIDIYCDCST